MTTITFTDKELLEAWLDMGQDPNSPDFQKFCDGVRSIRRFPCEPIPEKATR